MDINKVIKYINSHYMTPNETAQYLYSEGFEDIESAIIVWLSEVSGENFLK